jgi:hypothetical protein
MLDSQANEFFIRIPTMTSKKSKEDRLFHIKKNVRKIILIITKDKR